MLRPSPASVRRARTADRRGAQLIEFCFVLPIFLFLILFSIDMGRMVFYSGVVHDATYTAARAGAQVGGAGTGTGTAAVSRTAYYDVLRNIPGSTCPGNDCSSASFSVQRGQTCTKTGTDRYVQVRGEYGVEFITPGIRTLLTISGSGRRFDPEGSWRLPAVGVARCEVVRG